jgi:DNA polymerase III sliding clamp (beta) subunit (PCNA family)
METTHTVGAQELGRVLHNAALFASKDAARPILNGIEVSINGKVEATGTDSYRLGHDECPTLSGSGEATMVLEAKEVTAIAKELLKAGSYAEATITTTDAIVPGGSEGTEVTIKLAGRTWVLLSVYGTYPQWRMLIPAENATGEVSTIGLNADMLASFAKVKSDASPKGTMRLRFLSPTKPVVVSIGTSFCGVQMPVRMSN